MNHLHRADTVQARQIAAELRQLGDMTGDIVARVMACRTSGYTSLVLGDFAAARAYFEEGIALYDPSKATIVCGVVARGYADAASGAIM